MKVIVAIGGYFAMPSYPSGLGNPRGMKAYGAKATIWFYIFLCLILPSISLAQQEDSLKGFQKFISPAPAYSKPRFWGLTAGVGAAYTGTVFMLNEMWYVNYPRSAFHFKNDFGGWHDIDKFGHLYTAYFESKLTFHAYRWAGLPRKKAAWVGFGAGMLFQASLETLDGFSEGWGWSWGDIAFNTIGSTAFLAQELAWGEQKVVLKISAHKPSYSDEPIEAREGGAFSSERKRANSLYGSNIATIFIKEYNGVTQWASINLKSTMFPKAEKFPAWVNFAVGYGAENMFGAESNSWKETVNGLEYNFESTKPRYGQVFFSPDIDFTRIKTKSKILKILFEGLNLIKVPMPAFEVNTLGGVRWHWLYF